MTGSLAIIKNMNWGNICKKLWYFKDSKMNSIRNNSKLNFANISILAKTFLYIDFTHFRIYTGQYSGGIFLHVLVRWWDNIENRWKRYTEDCTYTCERGAWE